MYKNKRKSKALKKAEKRSPSNPNRQHVSIYSILSSRSTKNCTSKEIRTPANSSITQKITSGNTKDSLKSQGSCYWLWSRKRNAFFWSFLNPLFWGELKMRASPSRSSEPSFFCIVGIFKRKNEHQDSKTIGSCKKSYEKQNQISKTSSIKVQIEKISVFHFKRSKIRIPQQQFQNCIFTIIPCQKWSSCKAQRSKQKQTPRQRQRIMSTSSTSYILIIKTSMNNNSSPQKQQGFKTCMCYKMVESQSIMTLRQCHNYVSQLTTCTISNNTFHIILNQSHSPSHQSCHCTENSQCSSSGSTLFPKRICTGNLKNSSSDLCCSMNLSRNWSWSFHSICQPNMLSKLSTFSKCTTSNTKTKQSRILRRFSESSQKSLICRA